MLMMRRNVYLLTVVVAVVPVSDVSACGGERSLDAASESTSAELDHLLLGNRTARGSLPSLEDSAEGQ